LSAAHFNSPTLRRVSRLLAALAPFAFHLDARLPLYLLGGGPPRQGADLRQPLITMTSAALWHGASWNYVLWGRVQRRAARLHACTTPPDRPRLGGADPCPSPFASLRCAARFTWSSQAWFQSVQKRVGVAGPHGRRSAWHSAAASSERTGCRLGACTGRHGGAGSPAERVAERALYPAGAHSPRSGHGYVTAIVLMVNLHPGASKGVYLLSVLNECRNSAAGLGPVLKLFLPIPRLTGACSW